MRVAGSISDERSPRPSRGYRRGSERYCSCFNSSTGRDNSECQYLHEEDAAEPSPGASSTGGRGKVSDWRERGASNDASMAAAAGGAGVAPGGAATAVPKEAAVTAAAAEPAAAGAHHLPLYAAAAESGERRRLSSYSSMTNRSTSGGGQYVSPAPLLR